MLKFDEMYTRLPYEFFTHGAQIRDHYKIYDEWLARQPGDMMAKRREEAEMIPPRRHHLCRIRRERRGGRRH